jgi:hypothetical protein
VLTAQSDVCALYVPMVYGGQLDEWTDVDGLDVRIEKWPCPGTTEGPGVLHVCTCPCHDGGEPHVLPPRRTGPAL